ncbi:putative membrane-bound mannosyltransferase [Halanaeroarchaeum sp. HSR-CO]|uniref:flippase activity-associated protein Agl23 n=1 Tax=Halanaeroarchaeum sp. HSR-CO TaxID=2866382 RepID=UPI00217E3136|nr:flippase activity-associated protein Agl23 [Halanaeroarchaeum sp. HSR-CO]UWG48900.1 putative membrane-bound mannosyltransferase [Halanaeroarchaeum sp. HSR-CO]
MGRLRHLRRPPVALLLVVAVALLLRVAWLGARVAHQDEARVAHWILHYMAVEAWQYRPIIHGPFLPHVNGVVFSVLGPSDFTARLVVAVVGGLFPLAALLFRSRLRDTEVIALGLLLAGNPVLVYYSRFMRNDVLLAAFAVTALGLFVRAMDTGKARYLLLGAPLYGLAATTKENVLLYPIAWLGALVLLGDYRLLGARYREADPVAVAKRELLSIGRGLWRWKTPIVVGIVELAVVFVAFYAPKPDLYQALANPVQLPSVLQAATMGTTEEFLDLWGSTSMQEHSTVEYLGHLLRVVFVGGATTFAFSIVGFVGDRYGEREPRDLVAFAFYWGMASIVGYAIVSDIKAPWSAVHVLVPLAIPAAVGLSLVYRNLRSAHESGDRTTVAIAAVVLLLAASVPAGATVSTSYLAPQSPDNELVQYAQPAGDMKPTLDEIAAIADANEGVDVIFFGDEFYAEGDEHQTLTHDIETGGYDGWFERLPLPWYFTLYDANVSSTTSFSRLDENPPPVVIALEEDADEVGYRLDGYERVTHQGYLHSRPLVFFVAEDSRRS